MFLHIKHVFQFVFVFVFFQYSKKIHCKMIYFYGIIEKNIYVLTAESKRIS